MKNLPKMIEIRVSGISSSKEIFNEAKTYYENALRANGYRSKLQYTPPQQAGKCKNRHRNHRIIW